MTHPLQNHPGQRELPVRATIRNVTLDRTSQGQLSTAAGGSIALGVLGVIMLIRMDPGPWTTFRDNGHDLGALLVDTQPGMLIFWGVAILVALGLITLGIWVQLRSIRRPLVEQRRYYAWRGLTEPDDQLRRALRVSGSWMHLKGAWPLTMEYLPTAAGLSSRQVRWFRTLRPEPVEAQRDGMARDWGILNAQDAREAIESHLSVGVHSEAFAGVLREEGFAAADRFGALADVPTSTISDLACARDGRPPQLLWGWDLIRTAVIVRDSAVVGYLDRAEALQYLEAITELVATLFRQEEELVQNCQIGFALWAGSSSRTELRDRVRLGAEYLAGPWPATLGPWPEPSGRALPAAMADGFASNREGPDLDDPDAGELI